MADQPPANSPDSATAGEQQPLASVYTSNLPELFEQLNISLAITTYQAGKVILVRRDGENVNTHFRDFEKPMGLCVDGNRLTVGGKKTVWFYRDMPALAAKLDPPGRHDACYLPRRIHVTGDIDIHELEWASNNELWLVNTRFCCLCTLDGEHSFTPRWRPPFVSALAGEDRCHLNGLSMQAGKPKWVTALGQTDTAGGWRNNKARGGVIVDVETNETVVSGLSMPHSPRWHNETLWVLESGEGNVSRVNLNDGSWQSIATMPGFTRGLDFYGPLAFIGLSKVRQTAVFSDIPIVDSKEERMCGVWIVNIETGQTLGFLRFDAGVEEIFSVRVLTHTGYPEMLEWTDDHLASSYVLPDESLAELAQAHR